MENELVSHEINHAPAIAAFYEQNEALKDPAFRREHFASLEQDDFLNLLQQVNSLIRTGEDDSLQPFDGDGVALEMHDVPDSRDKEQLLRETWDVARGFLADKKLSDEDALAYAGLTVAGGILFSHPFSDSNGRSSRVVSHMIIQGQHTNTEDDLEAVLGSEGRDAWFVMPLPNVTAIYTNLPFEHSDALPEDIEWDDDFSFKEVGEIKNPSDPAAKMVEERFRLRALHHFALRTDDTARDVLRRYTKFDEAGQAVQLDAPAALKTLVNMPEKGIGYAAQLLEAERWSRADFVRRYLRIMQSEALRTPAGTLVTHMSELGEIADANPREISRFNAYGHLAVDGKITPRDHIRVNFAASQIVIDHELAKVNSKPAANKQ